MKVTCPFLLEKQMDRQEKKNRPNEVEAAAGNPSGHGFEPSSNSRSPLHESEESNAKVLAVTEASSTSLARRATGPQTPEGKQRSKYNALKHGIFSNVLLLKGESRAQYESLLRGLWEDYQPQGTLEEILVEKLAMILWRHRRLVTAETAEIRKSVAFLEWDETNQQQREAEATQSLDCAFEGGLIQKIQNPRVLERCLELLTELREGIEADGFDRERDCEILRKIYGREEDWSHETLSYSYGNWLVTSQATEEERQREGYASPAQCKKSILEEIDNEIPRLKRHQKTRASIESERSKLEKLRRSVPDSPGLDRLLRYEATLERNFDRTLSQLERLQRMRLGHPVLPPVKVELSG